jgi:hypothetical protein
MSEIKAYTNMNLARAHQADLHKHAHEARLARTARHTDDQEAPRVASRKLSPRRVATAFVTIVLGLTVAAGVALAQPASPGGSSNYDPGCQPSRTHTTTC